MDKRLLAEGKLFFAVTTLEFINLACGINNLLLTSIKRMALRTNLNSQVFTQRRRCLKFVSTCTSHLNGTVIWMNVCFHDFLRYFEIEFVILREFISQGARS